MVTKRARSFHRFLRTVESFTEGQVRVTDWDCDRLTSVDLDVKPNGGYYKGGRFKFTIRMEGDFPNEPPNLWCHTDVFHPNIDPTMCHGDGSNVCVSTLDEWQTGMGLDDAVQAVLFLFHNPNPEDPLSPYVSGFCDCKEEWEEFGDNVRTAMKGEEVEGHKFEDCWCEDDGTDSKNGDPETVAVDGACAVPDEASGASEVEIIIKKVDDIILTRTEAGKDESEDEMADDDKESEKDEDEEEEEEEERQEDDHNDDETRDAVEESQPQHTETELNAQNAESSSATLTENEFPVESSREGASAQSILSRQNSKLEKDTAVVTSQSAPDQGEMVDCDKVDSINTKVNCDVNLGDYLNRYKACSFVAPDFDQALYTLSAFCVYSMMKALNFHTLH